MPAIVLLRHGQASFGSADYDQLSDLGREQAAVAGRELALRGLRSPVLVSGALSRQRETAMIAGAEFGTELSVIDSRFDEFDAHGAVEEHLGRAGATTGMTSAEFQTHLDQAMAQWMAEGDPVWTVFAAEALAGLSELAQSLPRGTDAVVVTSAGVTAALVGALLHAGPEGVISMNRVSINASMSTVVSGSRGLSVISFNDHAHLRGESAAGHSLLTNR